MTGVIFKVIIGLFIWLVLPQIICKQGKFKKNTKKFVHITCQIVGIAIIVLAGIDFVKTLLNFH